MRLSRYLMPTLEQTPKGAEIASHRLMLRAGMIRQLSSGIYNWLPLGHKVLKKVENIVREELNKAGAVELLMPTIQPASLWQESGRGGYGEETLRMKDRHENEMIYGPTNEEVITDIFRKTVTSYKSLPLNLFHIQWKFRDEIRPRFGVMRGREFLMKDAYTFDIDEESAIQSYNNIYKTYFKIFRRMGLSAIPFRAETGLIGGSLSHEFQVIAATGESKIFYDEGFESLINQDNIDIEAMQNLYSAADERHDPENCGVAEGKLKSARGIEVGHIFYLDDKYSKPMKAKVTDKNGKEVFVKMGAHGIGVSRLVGAIIESSHDDRGIIWPDEVAPFKAAVINVKPGHEKCDEVSNDLYSKLLQESLDPIMDDTKNSAGKKFANMDLIGVPWQIAVGPRGVENDVVELKDRKSGEKQELSFESAISKIVSNYKE